MKLYSSCSIAEKQRIVEINERQLMERQQQAQQQELEAQQQQIQATMQQKQMELEHEDALNQRDNETKILIANIQSQNKQLTDDDTYSPEEQEKLREQIRQFNERLKLDRERLAFDKDKAKTDARLKEKQINKQSRNTTNK